MVNILMVPPDPAWKASHHTPVIRKSPGAISFCQDFSNQGRKEKDWASALRQLLSLLGGMLQQERKKNRISRLSIPGFFEIERLHSGQHWPSLSCWFFRPCRCPVW